MPFNANDARRHEIPKARDRVESRQTYEVALRGRGDLTMWVTPEVVAARYVPAADRPAGSIAGALRGWGADHLRFARTMSGRWTSSTISLPPDRRPAS
jgi:hypothetical protein